MRKCINNISLIFGIFLLVSYKKANKSEPEEEAKLPNILFILADDQYRKEFNFLT